MTVKHLTLAFIITSLSICSSFLAQKSLLATAKESWPVGQSGENYNIHDSQGEKDGVWIRVYPDGALYYSGSFNHGTPEGEFLYFYESGELMSKIVHPHLDSSDNTLEVITAIHYRENYSVQASGFYIDDVEETKPIREGSWGFYDEDSKQVKMETYSYGLLDGPYWVKGKKGQIVEEGEYSKDVLNGEKITYYDNGIVKQKINYSNGKLEGSFAVNYNNGYPKIEGKYVEGFETGSWKTYTEKGELELLIQYSNGNRIKEIRVNGTFEETYADGRSKSEYTYRDKLLDGPYRVWYDQGGYVIEDFTDLETGEILQRQVLKGTQVSREGSYFKGKLDGPVFYYNQNGELEKTENYKEGKLLNTAY
jgi:uncharacterized protein